MTKPTVGVCVLLERTGVSSAACLTAFAAIWARGPTQIWVPPMRVDLARNKAVEAFLKSDCTHLLMLDCDHRHPADVVERLTRWMVRDPAKQIISGLSFRRGPPYDPTVYRVDEDGTVNAFLSWEPGLVRADIVGGPCLLVSRDVYETIPAPWFAFRYENAEMGLYPGEDIYFSLKCGEYNFPIYVDTTCVSPHATEAWVDEKMYRAYIESRGGIEKLKELSLDV